MLLVPHESSELESNQLTYVVIESFNETISLQFCHWSCVLMQKGSTTQTTQMKQYNFCHVHRHIILYA